MTSLVERCDINDRIIYRFFVKGDPLEVLSKIEHDIPQDFKK